MGSSFLGRFQVLSPDHHGEGESALAGLVVFPKRNRRQLGVHPNFNVSKILPVTTFRTIDLGGKKNSGPLFSRFCAKQSVFFD